MLVGIVESQPRSLFVIFEQFSIIMANDPAEQAEEGKVSVGERVIRIGTRGSQLALAQAQLVAQSPRQLDSSVQFELVPLTTTGDRDRATSLTIPGGSGVFVKELHEALFSRRIDIAVHSAKDLPTQIPEGLSVVAMLPRADARDALVTRHGSEVAMLPRGAKIGTSSRRRQTFLAALRPDLQIVDIRGNVDTRLRKLTTGELGGLVLAAAGLARLGRLDTSAVLLDPEVFVPAPGQGAIAVVLRSDDPLCSLVAQIDDPLTSRAVAVERAFLRSFGSGCTVPIGAYATVEGQLVTLRVAVAREDGKAIMPQCVTWPLDEAIGRAADLARSHFAGGEEGIGWKATTCPLPLAGVRVLLVRPAGQEVELVEALQRLGAEPIVNPLIAIEPPEDWGPLDQALANLEAFSWVVFTSVNGVRSVLQRLKVLGRDREAFAGLQIAAIGPATAAELERFGLSPALVPAAYIAENVAASLSERGIQGVRILLPRATKARDVLPQLLRLAGAEVVVVPAYRTVSLDLRTEVRERLLSGTIDWVLLTASSTARSLAAAVGDVRRVRARIAAIGPVTAATVRELGFQVAVVAEQYTTSGLLQALVQAERNAR